MVSVYVDAGVLVKSYVAEANSSSVLGLLQVEALPLALTHFLEVEIRNAIQLKVFRQEITASEAKLSLEAFDDDIREQRLLRPSYSIAAVFDRANELSGLHTRSLGARTLDILHVAAACELGCTRFVSLDQRQRAVAKKAGLKVAP